MLQVPLVLPAQPGPLVLPDQRALQALLEPVLQVLLVLPAQPGPPVLLDQPALQAPRVLKVLKAQPGRKGL